MTRTEVIEAVALLKRVLDSLLRAPVDLGADSVGQLRVAVGRLSAADEGKIRGAALGADLVNCFDLARLAGATYDRLELVRVGCVAEVPVGVAATAINQACITCVLTQQSILLSETDFASRDDVDRVTGKVNAAFDVSIEYAADSSDAQTYQILVALHAAVIRDLVERARPLPRMVTYNFQRSFPTLTLASRLYGDAAQSDDLVLENKIVHPLFAPLSIRALGN
jgi:hypothetical protein